MARKLYPGERPPNWNGEAHKSSSGVGKVFGIGCLAVVGVFTGLAVLGAAIGDPDTAESQNAAGSSLATPVTIAENDESDTPVSPAGHPQQP